VRHAWTAAALAAAALGIALVFALIGLRGNDLERISEDNCRAINRLIESRNVTAAEGRAAAESIIVATRVEPPTAVERQEIAKFLDALFFTVSPYEC
jgi:hypothetical protein